MKSIASARSQRAFTLIEMSIVLVIIGLIVGGILVGQDLIRAAGVRSVLSDQEKIKAAVNTFRGKYDCIPGDCGNPYSIGLQPFPNSNIAATATGDGNGVISDPSGTWLTESYALSLEEELFWWQLVSTALISNSLDTVSTVGNGCTSHLAARYVSSTLSNAFWWVHYMPSRAAYGTQFGVDANAIFLTGPSTAPAYWGCGSSQFSEGVSVYISSSIDAKIDDGMPVTGNVQVISGGLNANNLPLQGPTPIPHRCIYTTSTLPIYATPSVDFDNNCVLVLKLNQ